MGAYQWALVSNDPRVNPQTHRGDDRQPLDQGSQGKRTPPTWQTLVGPPSVSSSGEDEDVDDDDDDDDDNDEYYHEEEEEETEADGGGREGKGRQRR